MDLIEKLDKKEIKEFFSKNWMTHDAMWFAGVMLEFGAEKANQINKGAVKAMAGIEIKRIMKLMGKPKDAVITTFEELKEIIDSTYKLIQPEFMKLYYGFPEKNIFRGGFHECFAHDGVSQTGLIDVYQCGIVMRVQGWFEGLGVRYEMTPAINGCLMHQNGKCEIEFKFYLD
jgi:hypothetical protein